MKKTTHKIKTKRFPILRHILCACFLIFLSALLWYYLQPRPKCDFYRGEKCITCSFEPGFPVGYKENCTKCENKTNYYIEEGLISAWLCLPKDTPLPEEAVIERGTKPCPKSAPLKDVVGNCYACDTEEPIRLLPTTNKIIPCQKNRYLLPDTLTLKSLKCPVLEDIHDPEICLGCHGIWNGDTCAHNGENSFCKNNNDCPQNQWCFPLRLAQNTLGVCTNTAKTKWICSQTDGYNLKMTQDFCTRQKAHIPTLEEIEQADEDLSTLCPTLDMWTFFTPDGVAWLESFTQEFLFTREGESESLGGHQFYALCHTD